MSGRRWVRLGSLAVATVCSVLFVQWRKDEIPGRAPEIDRRTIGLPFSPWCEFVSWYSVTRQPDGSLLAAKSERTRVIWASWSWPLLGGAVAGFGAVVRMRPARPASALGDAEEAW